MARAEHLLRGDTVITGSVVTTKTEPSQNRESIEPAGLSTARWPPHTLL